MVCKSCGSGNLQSFNGELAIHHPGREGLSKPLVLVFPTLVVCLNCGFTEFIMPPAELKQLPKQAAV